MYLGRRLFPFTDTDEERLALLERVIGSFPLLLAVRAEHITPGRFTYDPTVRVKWPPADGLGVPDQATARSILMTPPLSVSVQPPARAYR